MKEGDLNLVDQYLNGTLSGEELLAFEARLKEEEALAQALALEKKARRAIWVDGADKLRAELDQSGEELLQEEKPEDRRLPLLRRISWVRMAAAAVILIVGSLLVLRVLLPKTSSPYSNMNTLLAEQIADVPSPYDGQRGGDISDSIWTKASQAYVEADWLAAQRIFETVSQDAEKYSDAQFYLGLIALQKKAATEAVDYFQTIPENSVFSDRAQWLLALSYLQLGQEDTAIQTLQTILSTSNHKFEREARELLAHLEKE